MKNSINAKSNVTRLQAKTKFNNAMNVSKLRKAKDMEYRLNLSCKFSVINAKISIDVSWLDKFRLFLVINMSGWLYDHLHQRTERHDPPLKELHISTDHSTLQGDQIKLYNCYKCIFNEKSKGDFLKRYPTWKAMADQANHNEHGLTPDKWIGERFNNYREKDCAANVCKPFYKTETSSGDQILLPSLILNQRLSRIDGNSFL